MIPRVKALTLWLSAVVVRLTSESYAQPSCLTKRLHGLQGTVVTCTKPTEHGTQMHFLLPV